MDTTLVISGGILLGCLIGLSWFAGSDAPYVPTKMDSIKKILKLAGAKKGKKFYELGSGDGRVVIEAAKLGAASISKRKAHQLNLKNTRFIHGNIFSKNYSEADIVYIYLLHKGVKRLEEKLREELKKGSMVITQTYHFPNWKPYKKDGDFWFYTK